MKKRKDLISAEHFVCLIKSKLIVFQTKIYIKRLHFDLSVSVFISICLHLKVGSPWSFGFENAFLQVETLHWIEGLVEQSVKAHCIGILRRPRGFEADLVWWVSHGLNSWIGLGLSFWSFCRCVLKNSREWGWDERSVCVF